MTNQTLPISAEPAAPIREGDRVWGLHVGRRVHYSGQVVAVEPETVVVRYDSGLEREVLREGVVVSCQLTIFDAGLTPA